MSTSQDFRHIAEKTDTGRADRLFRAAVSAFCALVRPGRREIVQLEDLCLQLYDHVSEATLRYVAAALSECTVAPTALVRRLAGEPVEIAAPLLLRSSALKDIDLISLIGRNGAAHAQVIAQRSALSPTLAGLASKIRQASRPGHASATTEKTLHALRGMMLESTPDELNAPVPALGDAFASLAPFDQLRRLAFNGSREAFADGLATLSNIAKDQAHALLTIRDKRDLALILKSLELNPEQAFLIFCAIEPSSFGTTGAVRTFVDRFEAITPQEVAEALDAYQAPNAPARRTG